MNRVYTVGTLFSGIGVPDLACAMLGMDVLFQVEIDEFCQKVLAKHEKTHWPNVRRFTDVRSVGAGNLPRVDILVGGFPCQDLSFAGRRKGMGEGTRSGLWSAFARIIGELQPRIVVIENVPGILASVRQTRRVYPARKHANVYVSERERQTPPPVLKVLRQLSEMGYRFSAGCISAAELGAQHKRERWWCVAYKHSDRRNTTQPITPSPYDAKREFASYGDGRHNLVSETVSGSGDMAHSTRVEQKRPIAIRNQQRQSETAIGDGSRIMGYPYSIGIQGQWPAWEQVLGTRHEAGAFESAGDGRKPDGTTQSGVGRDVHGLARGLDFVRPVSTPNEPQFDYEPPRVVTKGLPDRANRIKALGNAWDFRNAYALMYWVNEFLNEQDNHEHA